MHKPPKKVLVPAPPDTQTAVPRIASHDPAGHLPVAGSAYPLTMWVRTPEASAAGIATSANELSSRLTSSRMPDAVATLLEANMKVITWPDDRAHQLRAVDDESGLFESPGGDTYAHVADEGYFRVVRQVDGRYRVYWPENFGESGPLLRQIEGQPHWRPEQPVRPAQWLATNAETTTRPAPPQPLSAAQVALLTSTDDSPAGFRYGPKRGEAYVDMEDGTTYMVRHHPDGGFQQASPHARNSLGARVVHVPETKYWRIRPSEDATQVQSKRARLPEPEQPAPGKPNPGHSTVVDPADGHWKGWGRSTRPEGKDSIVINDLHYAILPQKLEADTLFVYLENPFFAPVQYDAFEQMLKTYPSRQPKWAMKTDATWLVLEGDRLDGSMTGHVEKNFPNLASHSVDAITRTLFNKANPSTAVTGEGLQILYNALHDWGNRTTAIATRRELADPLLMLPVLVPLPHLAGSRPGHRLLLPLPYAEGLERIDFDTSRFGPQLSNPMIAPDTSLRAMFSHILEQCGYEVDRVSRMFSEDALIFKRTNLDDIFVMRFPLSAADGTLYRSMGPAVQLNDPGFRAVIAKSKWRAMLEYGRVVHLIGGRQILEQKTLFYIVREG